MAYEKSVVRILQRKEGQFFLTIPQHLVLSKEWDKGDRIKFLINNKGNLEIVKASDEVIKENTGFTENAIVHQEKTSNKPTPAPRDMIDEVTGE